VIGGSAQHEREPAVGEAAFDLHRLGGLIGAGVGAGGVGHHATAGHHAGGQQQDAEPQDRVAPFAGVVHVVPIALAMPAFHIVGLPERRGKICRPTAR